ncbi:19920_t:CDS:10 [Entrophospora sp. SA101]|nr:19920_t:CDS:10 [Entrophospora sp. SA101]
MSKSIKKKNQKRILIGAPNNEISSSRSSSSIIDDDEIINIKSLVQKILIYSGRPLKPLEPYKIRENLNEIHIKESGDDGEEEENEESVAMQVVIKKLENIDYNEEEEVVVEELENVDYDEESLVEWDVWIIIIPVADYAILATFESHIHHPGSRTCGLFPRHAKSLRKSIGKIKSSELSWRNPLASQVISSEEEMESVKYMQKSLPNSVKTTCEEFVLNYDDGTMETPPQKLSHVNWTEREEALKDISVKILDLTPGSVAHLASLFDIKESLPETEVSGLSEKVSDETNINIPPINKDTSNESRLPISILPDDPEKNGIMLLKWYWTDFLVYH